MTDTTMRQPTKIEPGSDMHLTVLMAPDHLNLVVGEDRAALLRYGQRVWKAATGRATAAERERAAKLCNDHIENRQRRGGYTLSVFDHASGGHHTGMTYAAAIRQGGTP